MSESGRGPCTATRKGINRLMTQEQFRLLNNCNITGNLWSVLKLDYNLIHHRARSITGMFRHFLYSISAFPFHKAHDFRNKPSLKSFLLKKPGFWPNNKFITNIAKKNKIYAFLILTRIKHFWYISTRQLRGAYSSAVERQIVDLVVVGSIPTRHPYASFCKRKKG